MLVVGALAAHAADVPRVIIDTDLGSSMDDLFTVDFAARMHRAGKNPGGLSPMNPLGETGNAEADVPSVGALSLNQDADSLH